MAIGKAGIATTVNRVAGIAGAVSTTKAMSRAVGIAGAVGEIVKQ